MSFYVAMCFWFFWCEISRSMENGSVIRLGLKLEQVVEYLLYPLKWRNWVKLSLKSPTCDSIITNSYAIEFTAGNSDGGLNPACSLHVYEQSDGSDGYILQREDYEKDSQGLKYLLSGPYRSLLTPASLLNTDMYVIAVNKKVKFHHSLSKIFVFSNS